MNQDKKFKPGQYASFSPRFQQEMYPECPASPLVKVFKVDGNKLLISHPNGDQLFPDQQSGEMLQAIWVEEEDLETVNFEAIDRAPVLMQIEAALQAKADAHLGKMVRTGKLACVSRIDYEKLNREYRALIDLMQRIVKAVTPILKTGIADKYLRTGGVNMAAVMGEVTRAVAGKSELVNALKNMDLSTFKKIDVEIIIHIAEKHGLADEEILKFIQKVGGQNGE